MHAWFGNHRKLPVRRVAINTGLVVTSNLVNTILLRNAMKDFAPILSFDGHKFSQPRTNVKKVNFAQRLAEDVKARARIAKFVSIAPLPPTPHVRPPKENGSLLLDLLLHSVLWMASIMTRSRVKQPDTRTTHAEIKRPKAPAVVLPPNLH